MSDSKVFMFPETGTNNGELMSVLAPLLSQRGVDPNVLLAMKNSNNGFGGEGGWFIWVIFLFFLMGWGGYGNGGWGGFGNRGGLSQGGADLATLVNNDTGRELLMSAIQGNGTAISQLASTLNCSVGNIQTAINGVMQSVQNVGNQVGMSSQQVINAIQAGNCQLGNQLAQCCCSIQDAITRQGYENQLATVNQTNTLQSALNVLSTGQERGFSSVAYETQRQTCDLQNSIKDATETIVAGQRAAELREMQNKIDSLRELNSQKDTVINNGQQTAIFSQMIQSATTPIATAVATLQGDVNGIKCKLPDTTTIAYSPVVGVPSCVAAQFGLNALGSNFGLWGNNSLWG